MQQSSNEQSDGGGGACIAQPRQRESDDECCATYLLTCLPYIADQVQVQVPQSMANAKALHIGAGHDVQRQTHARLAHAYTAYLTIYRPRDKSHRSGMLSHPQPTNGCRATRALDNRNSHHGTAASRDVCLFIFSIARAIASHTCICSNCPVRLFQCGGKEAYPTVPGVVCVCVCARESSTSPEPCGLSCHAP